MTTASGSSWIDLHNPMAASCSDYGCNQKLTDHDGSFLQLPTSLAHFAPHPQTADFVCDQASASDGIADHQKVYARVLPQRIRGDLLRFLP